MEKINSITQTISKIPPGWISTHILQSKSQLAHLSLTNPNDIYYRSKTIAINLEINPLLAAATGLFVALIQSRQQPATDIHLLFQELIHEIKAFETRAQTEGYRTEVILIARYFLCATLDEILLSNPWKQTEHYCNYKLLAYFHNEEHTEERFFVILDRLCAEPAIHIELLEFAYLCLSQGFVGKYRLMENGHTELKKLMEQIYRYIYQQRNINQKTTLLPEKSLIKITSNKSRSLPLWPLIPFACILLLTIYIGFTFMLESSATPLYQQLNSISQSYAEN